MTPGEQARLAALERRVEELERRLDHGPRVAPDVRAESDRRPPPSFPSALPGSAVPSFAAPPARAAAPVPAAPHPQLENRVGVNWISRIAVVTVVLALAFFFEYAFENHWITEGGRVLAGIACGAAALIFGERFWRGRQRAYGQSMAAAGIAFLYLSFWAAVALYHLVPQGAGFGLMVLAAAAGGFLALRYDSQAVALLGLSGGFAAPLLLHGAGDSWFVLAYALLLDAGALFAVRARRWRWPEPWALAGTAFLYLNQAPAEPFYAVFVVAYFLVFAAASRISVFIAAQVLAATALVLIRWERVEAGVAGAWLIAAAGLIVADRRRWAAAAGGSFAGFWLAYAIWSIQPEPWAPTLALLTVAYLLFLAWPLWRAFGRGQALAALDLVLLPLGAGLYFAASYHLLHAPWVGLFAVAVAVVEAAAARAFWNRDPRASLMAAGTAWVLLILAAPVQFAGYRITVVWALEAAAVVWAGVRLAERRALILAECLLALVLLRLLLLDGRMYTSAGQYGLLANARFLAFLVSAASLWASAWWIRTGRAAMAAYAAGHAVMLAGLGLEAVGWAARSAAPADFRSVASTAISALAAAYAVLLVAGGAAWQHAPSRVMGMGLIGLVVGKLYLYDVWLLGAFYRMAAFAILGVLLLVMSYVYSRRARA